MLGWGKNNVNFYGATAHSGPGPHRYRGFMLTLIYTTPHSVGLLWRTDQPDAETSTLQYITITRDKQPCPGGIRTLNRSKPAALDREAIGKSKVT
jgi:hypothetical protein